MQLWFQKWTQANDVYSKMKIIKTEVKTIFIFNSSLRSGEWFLREPRLSEGGQSQEEKLSIPFTQSVGERYLRVPAVTRPGSPGEMLFTNHHQAPERLTNEERGCGIKQTSTLLLSTSVQKLMKMFGKFEFPNCAEKRVIEFHNCAEECVIDALTSGYERMIAQAVPSPMEVLRGRFQGEIAERSERGVTLG